MSFSSFSACAIFCFALVEGAKPQAAQTGELKPCASLEAAWPKMVRRIEANLRVRDSATFRSGAATLTHWLDEQDVSRCPQFREPIALQRALIHEYLNQHSMLHRADADSQTTRKPATIKTAGVRAPTCLEQSYISLHDNACIQASYHSHASWCAWASQPSSITEPERLQRYLVNLTTDGHVVLENGKVGSDGTADGFVPLAQTPVLDQVRASFGSLQGQGPQTAGAVKTYVTTSFRYAANEQFRRVLFLNAAGGQIESFAFAVQAGSKEHGIEAEYLQYDGWQDGTLVTPKAAAAFVQKVLPKLAPAPERTLLVVNCNAGVDRSGTLNVLIQLAIKAGQDRSGGLSEAAVRKQGLDAIPKAVTYLKEARPHAISTFARYAFIYDAHAAYLALTDPSSSTQPRAKP